MKIFSEMLMNGLSAAGAYGIATEMGISGKGWWIIFLGLCLVAFICIKILKGEIE